MRWIKSSYPSYRVWQLHRTREVFEDQTVSLIKSEDGRFLRVRGVGKERRLSKQEFHYYHQHPEEAYMESLL